MSKPQEQQKQPGQGNGQGSNPGQGGGQGNNPGQGENGPGGSQGNKHYNFTIDRAPFKRETPTITGSEIRSLGGIPASDGIWQKAHAQEPDKEIAASDVVTLSEQSTEHFFSGAKTTTEG